MKTDDQIGLMRQAGLVVADALDAVVAAVRQVSPANGSMRSPKRSSARLVPLPHSWGTTGFRRVSA